uniref:Myb/SANT-like DNA-binding domain-containing protein n=1 Tax=Magallana gigas TaxID=29159 RepID=K1QSX7_MAGGI
MASTSKNSEMNRRGEANLMSVTSMSLRKNSVVQRPRLIKEMLFQHFRYYETMVLTFQDASHPDITVVVDRNEARRIREGESEASATNATTAEDYCHVDEDSVGISEKQDSVVNKWSNEAVMCLITLKKEHYGIFSSNLTTQKQAWQKVSEMMCLEGHHFTGEEYKTIKERNSKTGNDRQTWVHYNQMDDLLRGDPAVNPVSLASSMQAEGEPTTKRPPSKKRRQQEPSWIVEYRGELKTMHAERMELEREKLKLEERRVAVGMQLLSDIQELIMGKASIAVVR